jgi:chromobox protein 1
MLVDTIEQDDQGLHVYLDWNNGKKTRHPIEKIYRKCPMKMLRFYEQHLYCLLSHCSS